MGLSGSTEWSLMLFATLVAVASIGLAYQIYVVKAKVPAAEDAVVPAYQRVIYKTYYVNELYANLVTKPMEWLADKLNKVFEWRVVDAIVNGLGDFTISASRVIRLVQSGSIEFYMLVMVLGIALMLFIK